MPAVSSTSRPPPETLFTATVYRAEILTSIAMQPTGSRRAAFGTAARAMVTEDFQGHISPFDSLAAVAYPKLPETRRVAGRPVATIDLVIAAITRARGAGLVTRNVADFDGVGLTVINP